MFQLDAQVPQLVNSTPPHPEKGLCIAPRAFGMVGLALVVTSLKAESHFRQISDSFS